MSDSQDISYLGHTTHGRQHMRFGIKQLDRLLHTYVVGQTGVGKSSLLRLLAAQDATAGRGFALIDPHGDLVTELFQSVASEQRERIIYLDATNSTQPFGYNPLRRVRADKISVAASGLLETLRKLWPLAWGVRMEHVLRNTLYALIERDGSSLPDILRMYRDQAFRLHIAAGVRNPVVKAFWHDEFEQYHPRQQAEAVAPIQNKLSALLSDPTLYRVLVAPSIDLRFRRLMDEGNILLVNLSKGHLGEDSALVLGSLLVSTVGLAALGRTDEAETARRPFHLYVDEFHNFTTLSFATMMSELRKYGLGLTLAHQYLHQLDPAILHAVLGNAGTLIVFRAGAEDAPILAKQLAPTFDERDIINLPNHQFYTRLLIDGAPSQPFSGRLL